MQTNEIECHVAVVVVVVVGKNHLKCNENCSIHYLWVSVQFAELSMYL